ncbi:MAG: DUF885 domain-containing protein [Acidobacteriia bacterium]|nr:DUF885 domain-containing protein [Terriglobia bacterium]
MRKLAVLALALSLAVPLASADAIDDLGRDFWAWRATTQPFSGDDIPRIERPDGWKADWSPAAITTQRRALAGFEQRWGKIPPQTDRAREVDRRLLGSAIMRVKWELDVLCAWQRNPRFYNAQTIGALFDALIVQPPFGQTRSDEIVRRLESVPAILGDARQNLTDPAAPFARVALLELKDIRPRLLAVARELKPAVAPEAAVRLEPAMERAIVALESYAGWLQQRLPQMSQKTAIGGDNYVWFLKNVALLPYAPEQLLQIGRLEWARSVAFEDLEHHRDRGLPDLKLAPSAEAQIKREAGDELAVRQYFHEFGILDLPDWLQHYRNLPMPRYLAPLSSVGVTDDLTSPTRLKENGVRYLPPPAPDIGYFAVINAKDPRTSIVHEGVHYMQMAWSWAHEDLIRRHYYDSGANEGIAFYNEEMMVQAGLFDDSPRTREIIYNMARLRALRVEVDVKLALGQFTIEQGAEYLSTTVPMDAETAHDEAAFFASDPGQAISYQIGKAQILGFLAQARRKEGDSFLLNRFHDFVWKNGNVPIALQKYEYLGDKADLDAVERLH